MNPFFGPDRFRPDHHPFENRVGVGFEEGAVHEGPRVPFVAVADEIFRGLLFLAADVPLLAGRKARAPRPLRPESLILEMISSGVIFVNALAIAS